MFDGRTKIVDSRREFIRNLPKNSVGAEIGVFSSYLTMMIVEEVQPSKLYTVDAFQAWSENSGYDGDFPHENNELIARELTKQYECVDLRVGMSAVVATSFPSECLDWVYIDACHEYYWAKKDFDAWIPKVRSGGLICGHDYPSPYLDEAQDQFMGVKQVVAEYCIETSSHIDVLSYSMHGYTKDDIGKDFERLFNHYFNNLIWRSCDFAIRKK